jgi:short-subunit dehydrogenase
MKVLIVGATSAIAEATARRFAARGAQLFLAARNTAQLEAVAADLRVRGAREVGTFVLDANEFGRHEALLDTAWQQCGGIDIALIAHGTLSDQSRCECDVDLLLHELNTNALSTIALSTRIAARFEAAGAGTLAVISSVAGERGRASNYVYGAAKAAVTCFLSGLAQRLAPKNIQVLTIKPGFVDTPMTRAFRKGLLWASPETVAAQIERAIEKKCTVLYTPHWWAAIMLVIRTLPTTLFLRFGPR